MGSYSRKRYATESASFPKSENSAPGSYSYPTFADLPASGSTPGNTAFVVATNNLYIWSGVGWYLIATVTNASPTAITGVSDTYALAIDGTATTITAVSTDPEGFSLTWSYAVSSGSLGSTATVSQADNVFTITPSTDTANVGTFSLTFSVTDGINGVVSAVSSFTLSFVVTNSRYTSLSVKATNTGSNQTFDDASTSNHTVTANGDVTASTFSPYRHGGYSIENVESAGGYITIPKYLAPYDHNSPSTDTFTLETWAYQRSRAPNGFTGLFAKGYLYIGWGITSTGKLYLYNLSSVGGTTYEYINETSNTVPLNTWTHLALAVSGGGVKMFIDGNLETLTSVNANPANVWGGYLAGGVNTQEDILGGSTSSTNPHEFNGYVHNYRISDIARYSTNFTPAESFTSDSNTQLLIGRLPYLKDLSPNNSTLIPVGGSGPSPFNVTDNAPYSEADHGASAYFDGTGDYLNLNGDAEFAFGTNDFTVEFWVYLITGGATTVFCDFRPSGVNGTYTTLFLETDNTIKYFHQNGTRITSTSTIPLNAWSHVALVRQGYYVRLFINGQQEGSTFTNSLAQLVGANGPVFGSSSSGQFFLNGYMSDIRVLNGTCAYFSNFTPPTSPLTTTPPVFNINVTNSGASAYTLTSDTLSTDMSSSNPTVNMAVGQTVNFVVNASGHPFHIRVSDGGADVSTPVATNQGTQSGTVTWTPNTAGTYYYQCSVHSGMIGTINVTESAKLLLNPEPSISDLSQSSEITCFGDAATSTTQVKFAGTKSIAFDGTGDYLRLSASNDFDVSLSDITIEGWFYTTSTSVKQCLWEFYSNDNNYVRLFFEGGDGNTLRLTSSSSGTQRINVTSSTTLSINTWYHIAVTRTHSSGAWATYINGTVDSSASGTESSSVSTATWPFEIGRDQVATDRYWNGYIQDFRITKGLARYTSNFTPPTAELEG